ncbi:hypothetical protein, partial [Methanoregula sp.]|uniref:hypothetical protein n=1 Tax=Methanoregula sp. TaxID=2052170 RepID=UPI000CADC545
MKSPVKSRLMKILLDGEPHREIDLATGVGFTKVATIRKLIDSFERARILSRRRDGENTGWICQLNLTHDAVVKIYHHPELVLLRPLIREQPWFAPLFTANFDTLPDPLPSLIQRMVVQSHTFFEIICRYDSPETIRETYEPVLVVNRLSGIRNPLFNDLYLWYQIYVHAVIRDIDHGGLGSGFAGLLAECQQELVALSGSPGSGTKDPQRTRRKKAPAIS